MLNIAPKWNYCYVALLAEGVDRNLSPAKLMRFLPVALLAEGVDRNLAISAVFCASLASPSSRRAWIEIACRTCTIF